MLHVRAIERILNGELPSYGPCKTYAGTGSNCTCALCDAPILESEIECELEFVAPDSPRPSKKLRHSASTA